MIAIPTIRIVCYTSKALQVVPTSAPMNVFTLGNSIASREVISPAVAVSVAFAKTVAMPTIGHSLATLEKLLISRLHGRHTLLVNEADVGL